MTNNTLHECLLNAQQHIAKHQYHEAIALLQQANALEPQAYILNNLANAYKKNKQIPEAISCYLQAIALDPDYAQAHNNLANAYAMQNQYEDALQHYIKATHAAPDFTQAHFNLALLLLKNNELNAAKIQFNNVLALDPTASEALFYLGIIHLNAQELDDAKKAFTEVLALNEEHVHALVNLGVIALKHQEDQIAIDYFSKALAIDNEEWDARNNLAATFMHHDRFENALMHYDVLLQHDPKNEEYLYNAGVAQMTLGHLNEAILLFEQLEQQNPKHTPALTNLAAIHIKSDNHHTAKTYLERALAITPEDKISQHLLHAISGVKDSPSTPEYAQNLFNNYALYYEQHMQGTLHYSLPEHILRTLKQLKLTSIPYTLDLGCGTGLSGAIIRDLTTHLIGIDIAEKMLAHAQKKGCYDELIHADILQFLNQDTRHYTLILAADVLPYFGDLEELMRLISNHLAPEAYFIFSSEVAQEQPWQLQHSARFSHHPHYIATLAAQNDLRVLSQETIPARLQQDKPLELMLYVLQKGIASV